MKLQNSCHWQDKELEGAVHSTTRASHERLKGVELIEIDYNKPGTLLATFKDVDKLFLLTPASSEAI